MNRVSLAVMRRELRYMWRDRGLRYIIWVGPLLGIFLFMGIYQAQVVKDIPTAVVDLDRSSGSREMTTMLKGAENLSITTYPESYMDLEKLIQEGRVMVGIVIPENFARNVSLHRPTRVLMIIDASNSIYATNASTAVLGVARTISAQAGIKTLVAGGMEPGQAKKAYLGIDFKEEPWFNPTLNYAYFLVLALALNIWQQCCSIASSINIIGETGMASWLQVKAAGVSRFRYFASKSLIHVTTFMLMVLPVYWLAFEIMKFPLACGWGPLLAFTLAFAIALHSVGTLMSSAANNAVDSTRLGMMVALPSFVLSGYTWPLHAMPGFLQPVAWVFPQTWFFQGFNYLAFKNPGWSYISSYFMAMAVYAVVCYGLTAFIIYRLER